MPCPDGGETVTNGDVFSRFQLCIARAFRLDFAPPPKSSIMRIGRHELSGSVVLAPMAGITDRPFRRLCRAYGAALAFSEMISSNPKLRDDRRSLRRADHAGEIGLRAVQLVGADPRDMAEAARLNVARGAEIIDINMGCPAKKVCNKAAGSALLRDEVLVGQILAGVVESVSVPVTLKIRTGWSPDNKNAVRIARIAESAGIQSLTVHGRTRACGFSGDAEYATVAEVKAAVALPVIANGDIDSPEKAAEVLRITRADAVMIGRAALGKPWLFHAMNAHIRGEDRPLPPADEERFRVMLGHVDELYSLYGEITGVRVARKHIGWYLGDWPSRNAWLRQFNRLETSAEQTAAIERLFENGLETAEYDFGFGCGGHGGSGR